MLRLIMWGAIAFDCVLNALCLIGVAFGITAEILQYEVGSLWVIIGIAFIVGFLVMFLSFIIVCKLDEKMTSKGI